MLKKLIILLLFVFGTGLLVGYRTFQLMFFIEPFNGFFYSSFADSRIIFAVCLGLFAVAVAVIVKLDNVLPIRTLSKSVPLAVISFVYALLVIFFTIEAFGAFAETRSVILVPLHLTLVVFLSYYAYTLLSEKTMPLLIGVLPILAYGGRLVLHFLDSFRLVKSSEITLEIIMLIFAFLFWHALAKHMNIHKFKKARKHLLVYGVIAAALCFIITLPSFIIPAFFGNVGRRVVSDHLWFDLATGVYIAVFLFITYSKASSYKQHSPAVVDADALAATQESVIENEPVDWDGLLYRDEDAPPEETEQEEQELD